jgi:aminoglycoside/choline kinase family phosphotransferase
MELSPPGVRPSTLDSRPSTDSVIPAEFPGLAELARQAGLEPSAVEVLPGDVGRRRYLRLNLRDGDPVLGVVYHPEEADSRRRWVAAHTELGPRLRVPRLIADDREGNHIVEDFGRTDLAALLSARPEQRVAWIERAASAAVVLAQMADPRINPPFDAAFFRRELDLAREAVFELYLGRPLSSGDRDAHDAWAESLAREIAAHPSALCHRDYHGNNLFPLEDRVGWIDFQDMRSGPDAYDLASLLWERTTLDWMTPEVADRAIEHFARGRGLDLEPFRARLDRVLLQRAWKVCGTFARAIAQGRGEIYRWYLPGELRLVRRLLADTPEDARFSSVFDARLARLC